MLDKRLLCIPFATLALIATAAPTGYTIVDLGVAQQPTAINRAGTIAGATSPEGAEGVAEVYRDGTWSLLESRKATSFAAALNKHGVIVGWDGRRRPARWVHGERRVLTGVKKGQATGIGDDGTIAGTSLDHEVPRCFSWKDGAAADLGTLGGDHCYVYGIDSTGRYIAGESDFSFAPARYHAFIHDENGMHDLGSLPGEYVSTANAVNRYGHASVTALYDDSGDQAAVYWDGVRLVQVPGVNAGGNWSIGGAINDRDQMLVAGWDTEGHALFLYDGRSGVVTAIQPLIHNIEGWTFGFDQDLYITGLTNDGRIVGATNYQNELHGFLLVPDSQ